MADDLSPDVLAAAKKWGVSPDLYAAEQSAFPGSTITSGLRPLAYEQAMTGLLHSAHVAPPGGQATALDLVLNPATPQYMKAAAAGYHDPNYAATFEPKNLTHGSHYSTGDHIHYALKKGPPPPPHKPPSATPMTDTQAVTGVPAPALTKDLNSDEAETGKLLAKQEEAYGEYAKKLDEWDKKADDMFPRYNELLEARKKLLEKEPKVPDATKLPEEKLPPIRDPVQALGTFLPMLAMLGGALNKRYAMGALKAATGAMKAQKAGDYEARDQAHQLFMDNMKVAIENESSALTQYTNERAKFKGDLDENMNGMAAIASQFQDMGMSALVSEKKVQAIDAMLKARGEVLNPLVRMSQAAMLQNSMPMTQAEIDMLATRFNLTGTLPPLGNSRTTGFARNAILQRAAELSGGAGGVGGQLANAAIVKGAQASVQSLAKQAASIDPFINTTQQEGMNALKLLHSGGPQFIPSFNKYIQSGRKAGGSAEVVKFETFLLTLRNEYAKIMTGSTGSVAQTSVGHMAEIDAMLNGNMAPGQIEAIIPQMIYSANLRKQGIQDEMKAQEEYLRGLSVGQPVPQTPKQESGALGTQGYPMPMPSTLNGLIPNTWYMTSKGPLRFAGLVETTEHGKKVQKVDMRAE